MGQDIQESKTYGRQPLKNFSWSNLEYLDPYIKPYYQLHNISHGASFRSRK